MVVRHSNVDAHAANRNGIAIGNTLGLADQKDQLGAPLCPCRIWYNMDTDAEGKGFIMPGKVHGGRLSGLGIFRWTCCCVAVMVLFGIGYKTTKNSYMCTQTRGSSRQRDLVVVVVVLRRRLLGPKKLEETEVGPGVVPLMCTQTRSSRPPNLVIVVVVLLRRLLGPKKLDETRRRRMNCRMH